MTVQDIADYANAGELSQLDIQLPQLLTFINLAVIELHTRFRLLVNEAIVTTNTVNSVYTLPQSDLTQILAVYDINGYPCILNDYEYAVALNEGNISGMYTTQAFSPYGVNTPSYNQIQVTPKVNSTFSVIYAGLPTKVTLTTDVLAIPAIMTEALLHYIGYRAHGSYNADIKTENNTHYMRFEASCKKLSDFGYAPATAIDKIDLRDKGYV